LIGTRAVPARFVAAVSGRTHKKDSFAALKVLLFNDFLYFAQCDLPRDLTAGSCCGSTSLGFRTFARCANPREYASFALTLPGETRRHVYIDIRPHL
jgi:hypothetical protein